MPVLSVFGLKGSHFASYGQY